MNIISAPLELQAYMCVYICACMSVFAGAVIPDITGVMRTVLHAHIVATPDVPLVGWDVALTPGMNWDCAGCVSSA